MDASGSIAWARCRREEHSKCVSIRGLCLRDMIECFWNGGILLISGFVYLCVHVWEVTRMWGQRTISAVLPQKSSPGYLRQVMSLVELIRQSDQWARGILLPLLGWPGCAAMPADVVIGILGLRLRSTLMTELSPQPKYHFLILFILLFHKLQEDRNVVSCLLTMCSFYKCQCLERRRT